MITTHAINLLTCFFWQQSADDVSQFDSKFTSQTPVDSPDDSTLSESANQAFLVSAYCRSSQQTATLPVFLSVFAEFLLI